MLNIGILLGSTRPGRKSEAVGKWVYELAQRRGDARFELVDIKEYELPLLDERYLPAMGRYEHEHTKAWSKKIAEFDGYVFVTPEYNHAVPAALKNALDYLYTEWADKSVGFVGYGAVNGVRAVEQLRQIVANFRLADVQPQVGLSTFTDFEDEEFKPNPRHEKSVSKLLDDVILWGGALKAVRKA